MRHGEGFAHRQNCLFREVVGERGRRRWLGKIAYQSCQAGFLRTEGCGLPGRVRRLPGSRRA